MPRLKLVLYLIEKCSDCEFIQAKMGNTLSKMVEHAPNINFTQVICEDRLEAGSLQQALHSEAEGVLILSCRPEDCLDKMELQAVHSEPSLSELIAPAGAEGSPLLTPAGGKNG